MDLATESECSVEQKEEEVEDNDVTSVPHFHHVDPINHFPNTTTTTTTATSNNNNNNTSTSTTIIHTNTNGSCPIEDEDEDEVPNFTSAQPDINLGFDHLLNSPPSSSTKKGYGLKKWKRIPRDFVTDSCPSVVDSSKILKRGLSAPANSTKPVLHLSVDVDARQKSDGSVGSVNMLSKNYGDYLLQASSSDSRLAVGSVFAAGTDSENSEDRSSKSSTAASVPKMRYDMPAVSGYPRDKTKLKNSLSGKGLGSSPQRTPQGKPRVETTKKARGEKVKSDKENSHSSMESDSRSSNFVFMQGGFSANSNGEQSGKPINYDEDNSDEARASEHHFTEDLQTGYSKENVQDIEDLSEDDLGADLSSWKSKKERSEKHLPPMDNDPLVKSVLTLQSVQESLEKELQKFVDIGKEHSFTSTESVIHPSHSENFEQSASCSLETEVISLTQKVNSLEGKLDEVRALLKAKESRVLELEATLNCGKSPKEESEDAKELQQENFGEMETELECLYKQKIEAEIEYLAIVRTTRNLRNVVDGHIALFEEQKTLAAEQAQMRNKVEEAESKAEKIKKQADILETSCEEILETEEVVKMRNRVSKVTRCFSLQFVILVVFIWWFVFQLSPHSGVVVPT